MISPVKELIYFPLFSSVYVFCAPIFIGKKVSNFFPVHIDQKIVKKVKEISDKMGVHKKIHLSVSSLIPWSAHGTNLPFMPAGVCIERKEFLPLSSIQLLKRIVFFWKDHRTHGGFNDATLNFILAHEISHIKHNDTLKIAVIPFITAVALSKLLGLTSFSALPSDITKGAIHSVMFISMIIFSKSTEKAADQEACKYLSDRDKKAAIQFFKDKQKEDLRYRNDKSVSPLESILRNSILDRNGNHRVELTHPSNVSRIKYIESTMNKNQSFFRRFFTRS